MSSRVVSRGSWVVLLVGLTVAQGSAAQSLASRIAAAPDGEVRLAFAAREGVCGDGRTFIRDRNRDDYISFEADDSHWKGRTRWRERPCEDAEDEYDDGPGSAELHVRLAPRSQNSKR